MEWYYVAAILGMLLALFAGAYLALLYGSVRPRIRTLLLDADGTLLDFDKSESSALEKAFEAMGYPFSEETVRLYHGHNLACWKQLERGEITREELKPLRFRKLFDSLGISGDPEKIYPVYEDFLGQYGFAFDGAEAACARLKKRYDLILVTNGTKAVQQARLAQTSLPKCFKKIYISEDVGYAKPAPEFFDRIFDDFPKMKRTETMIVGDSLSGDIAGGNGAGIRTCWVNRTGELRPADVKIDLEIDDITKLEKELLR